MKIKGNINAGYGNIISGTTIKSSILGGENNNMSTSPGQPQVIHSSIVGGVNNGVYRELSVILNGYNNNVSAPLSALVTERKNTILNGNDNLISNGEDDLIGGGNFNTIDGTYYSRTGTSPNRKNTITNGYNNSINASIYNFIGGGSNNVIEYYGGYNNIVGGDQNRIFGSLTSIIGGGGENFIGYGRNNVIGAGQNNILTGSTNETVIVGGKYNYITDSDDSSIVGGSSNRLLGVANNNRRTFIGGGINNTITASTYSSILGGQNNIVNNHTNAHIIGSNITSIAANTTHVEKLNVGTLNGTTPITNLALDANGFVVDGSSLSGGTFCTLITETISACTNHISFYPIGNVGIKTSNPTFDLEVNGTFGATSKSFDIPHPTQEGKRLRYGSLEGPEYGVYVRGKLSGENIIELPDHWTGLVDENSITVQLTPYGRKQDLFVGEIINNTVEVLGDESPECYYIVFGERKDIDKITVEY